MKFKWLVLLIGLAVTWQSISNGQVESSEKNASERMSPELLWKLGRLGEAAVSENGGQIVYTVRNYEVEKDSGTSTLHLLNAKTNKHSSVIEDWSSISSVQWAQTKEGERIFFVGMHGNEEVPGDGESDEKNEEESPQAWSLNPSNGDTIQLTNIEGGIANLKVSPTGSHVAFTIDVKMDAEVKDVYQDLPKADARIIDGLMYRHWNAWHDYKYSHLHVAELKEDGIGEPIDLMKNVKADCPVPPFGGAEQFNWSPDGTEIAYTMKDVKNWAESTNSDVYVVKIEQPSEKTNVSSGMPGYDNNPVYSPDGKYIAFHSMERASFESDRNRIMIMDRNSGEIEELTTGLDQTAHDARWTQDSKAIIFSSEFRGTNQLFRADLDSTGVKQISEGRFNWSIIDILPDGDHALVSQMNMLRPKELVVMNLNDKTFKVVSNINDDIYENLELPNIEERWVDATDGKKIHCWVIHPPGFDATENKKWPMLVYCQGGPSRSNWPVVFLPLEFSFNGCTGVCGPRT